MFHIDRNANSLPTESFGSMLQAAEVKLAEIRNRDREKWIDYFEGNRSEKPSKHWSDPIVKKALYYIFRGNCAYCGEEVIRDKATIDHFLPIGKTIFEDLLNNPMHCAQWLTAKSFYEDRVYQLNNYVLSCETCNGDKGKSISFPNPCVVTESCSHAPNAGLTYDIQHLKFIKTAYMEESLYQEMQKIGRIMNGNNPKDKKQAQINWMADLEFIQKNMEIELPYDELKELLNVRLESMRKKLYSMDNIDTDYKVIFKSHFALKRYIYEGNWKTPSQKAIAHQLLAIIDQPYITQLM
jgi:5-methylcytosine-specific restriction endonuclease McrA